MTRYDMVESLTWTEKHMLRQQFACGRMG